MSDTELLEKFAEIVNEATRIPADRVTPEKSFADDLDIDSLSMVEIATAAEDAFSVRITDDALSSIKTVQDALDVIAKASVTA